MRHGCRQKRSGLWAAAGLAGVLLLAGCQSDSSGARSESRKPDPPPATAPAPTSPPEVQPASWQEPALHQAIRLLPPEPLNHPLLPGE